MPRTRHAIRRLAPPLIAVIGALIGAPAAFAGAAWSVEGSFAPSTTPVLGRGSADPTAAALAYEPGTGTLRLRIDFAAPPARTPIHVSAGSTQPGGTCLPNGLVIDVAAQDHLVPVEHAVTTRTWVPQRTEIGESWSERWPPAGSGWTLLSYDKWSRRYKWIRVIPGRWLDETHYETSLEPDPNSHERAAGVGIDGADGVLEDVAVVADDATTLAWTFASPLLDGTAADCLSVRVASRRGAFTITAPLPEAPPAIESATLRRAARGARERGRTLRLRLRGSATAVQLRIAGRRTPSLPFARALSVRTGGSGPLTIAIRFSDGRRWTAWRTVRVR